MAAEQKNWEQIRERLARRTRSRIHRPGYIPSAVLLLLYERDGKLYLLFTKRTDHLEICRGQICFPGGAQDQEDQTMENTALREVFEEVGLERGKIEVLGFLDDCVTLSSNHVITPVVGFLAGPPNLRPNPEEVQEIIEIPLAFLTNYLREKGGSHGAGRVAFEEKPVFRYGGHEIWGATARILYQFLNLFFPSGSNPVKSS